MRFIPKTNAYGSFFIKSLSILVSTLLYMIMYPYLAKKSQIVDNPSLNA